MMFRKKDGFMEMDDTFLVLGITGGVGSGKSEVLRYLKEAYHACVLSCDDIAKELQEPGGSCYEMLKELLGPEYLNEDGTWNRQLLAQRIFSDENMRCAVNQIVHPAVEQEVRNRIKNAQINGSPFAAVESAILIESGYSSFCDELWYVYAGKEVRMKRLMESRGYSVQKAEAIMKAQKEDAYFREHCVFLLDNSDSIEKMREQADGRLKSYGILQYSERQQW